MVRLLKGALIIVLACAAAHYWHENDPERAERAAQWTRQQVRHWGSKLSTFAASKLDALLDGAGAGMAKGAQPSADSWEGAPYPSTELPGSYGSTPVAPLSPSRPDSWAGGPASPPPWDVTSPAEPSTQAPTEPQYIEPYSPGMPDSELTPVETPTQPSAAPADPSQSPVDGRYPTTPVSQSPQPEYPSTGVPADAPRTLTPYAVPPQSSYAPDAPSADSAITPSTETAAYPSTPYPTTDATAYPPAASTPPAQDYLSTAPSYPTVGEPAAAPPQAPTGEPPMPWETFPWESTKIIATVDGEWILAGDIMGAVNRDLANALSRVPRKELAAYPDQVEALRMDLIRAYLMHAIQAKVIAADASRKIPEENLGMIREELAKQFERTDLKKAMQEAKVDTPAQMDEVLRKTGSSLEREKRAFVERALAQGWMHQNVKYNDVVSHDELLAYYQEHVEEFEFPSRARWQQIMVRFAHYPSKAEAWRAIAELGNRLYQGEAFEQLVQSTSGGVAVEFDWATAGSLASEVLDRAVFSLPVGQLSQILEDDRAFYIVRVTEREEAHRTPFPDAQAKIRETIRENRRREAQKKFIDDLTSRVQVTSILDDLPEIGRKPAPSQSAAGAYR